MLNFPYKQKIYKNKRVHDYYKSYKWTVNVSSIFSTDYNNVPKYYKWITLYKGRIVEYIL